MDLVERLWRAMMDGIRFSGLDLSEAGPPLEAWLLGLHYASHRDAAFRRDLRSRIWVSYRTGFEALAPSNYTSDVGWGCMVRSGQMMVANAMVQCFLGREWRLEDNDRDERARDSYCRILSLFLDCDGPSSPLSLHNIAKQGADQLGISIGNWFGPSTVSQAVKAILNHCDGPLAMRTYVAMDGTLCKADALAVAKDAVAGWTPLLILVPLRLGIDSINPVYYQGIKACFRIPYCVGIAGGKPNSSLFLLGTIADHGILLDPHTAQQGLTSTRDRWPRFTDPFALLEAVEMRAGGSLPQDFATYHFQGLQTIPIARLDPSLVVGFVCRSEDDFAACCDAVAGSLGQGKNPLLSVIERFVAYDDFAPDGVDDDDF
ncbi:hypothetical protein DFJ74DRAFT_302704 [Hyaloraphidium curvatum]|nr:hypothetical protein DFJ74DRAFT_302704 [Hyaloraphidium curvatum]